MGGLPPTIKIQTTNEFVILSFGVDPLNWPSFSVIGEMACSTPAWCTHGLTLNVIEKVVKQGSSIGTEHDMTAFLCLSEVKAMSFVNFMQANEKESDTGVIRLEKHDFHLAPGGNCASQTRNSFCPEEEDLPVVFEPKAEGAWPEGVEVKESPT